jgi:hypothetical protein
MNKLKLSAAIGVGSFFVAIKVGTQNIPIGTAVLFIGFASSVIIYYKK